MIPIFPVTIKNNFPSFEDGKASDRFVEYCKTLRGKECELIVRPRTYKRSNQQNAYYWGVVIKLITDDCGYGERDEILSVHDTLRTMFLKRNGFLGKPRVMSTTELSTKEFEEYLEQVRRWAAIALSVQIPLPNEVEIPSEYLGAENG